MTEFSSSFEKKILQTLNRMAERVAEDAKSNAASLPDVVADAIEVGKAVSLGNGEFSVSVRVDTDKAKMAAAYEFGSGIHTTRGEAKKYRIPSDGVGLAFFWDKVNASSPTGRKFRGILPDGRAGFTFVEHPGVASRPYLTPALKSNVQITKLQLKRAFGDAFREVTPKIVLIKAK